MANKPIPILILVLITIRIPIPSHPIPLLNNLPDRLCSKFSPPPSRNTGRGRDRVGDGMVM